MPEKKPNHPEADEKFKDDGILALAIALEVTERFPYEDISDESVRRHSVKEEIIRNKNLSYGGISRRPVVSYGGVSMLDIRMAVIR